jgi:predicted nucleic acid-binding protein
MAAADPELEVLQGRDGTTRATLLATLAQVRSTYPLLAIDEAVATHFARLVAGGTTGGTEDPPPRHWIAATALRHGAAVLTQDADFTYFTFVEVIRV